MPKFKNRPNKLAYSISSILLALGLTSCGSDEPKQVEHVTCETPENIVLNDIPSLIKWINALPKPTTLPCFVESLPRPLYVNMSESLSSAQPAISDKDPRVFMFFDNLTISIVTDHDEENVTPEGKEFNLLEMAFLTTDISNLEDNEDILSIKGEIGFPITEDLLPESPHKRIVLDFTDTTSACALCHTEESEAYTVGDDNIPAYQSLALKPFTAHHVTLETMEQENNNCTSPTESYRCLMLSSLLDYGDVYEQDFPEEMKVFGN